MINNIKMFKTWYKLAKPDTYLWIYQFLTAAIPSVCLLSEAIYTARVTTALASGNITKAIISLTLVLVFMLLRAFAWDLNYRNTIPLVSSSYKRIQSKIFDSITKGKEKNFKEYPKEVLINIFHSEVYDASKFSDTICSKFRYFFQIILTLFYVFGINTYVGFILLIVIILNYYITDRLNDMISLENKKVKEATDEEFQVFSEIVDSKYILDDLDIKEKIKDKYFKSNDKFLNAKHNYTVKKSYLDNYFFMFCRFVIYFGSLLLVYLLTKDLITLTIYFVIESYLTDSITNSIDFLSILTELKSAYIAANRVNIILNFEEMESIDVGTLDKDNIEGTIDFMNVSYKSKEKNSGITDINNVSFHINKHSITLFKGTRSSGKRTIFYLLRRMIKPDNGYIYIDKINILDFNKLIYKNNVNYVTTKPYFYEGSVISNLKLVCNNKDSIKKVLEEVELYEILMSKKSKLKTSIKDLSMKELYLLSLARVLLMKSEILVLYEFPNYLSDKDIEKVKNIILKYKKKKTIIIFSANNDCKNIADTIYLMDKGTLKKK